jgi:hypothetical protein
MFKPGWRHDRRWRLQQQLENKVAEVAALGWTIKHNGERIPADHAGRHVQQADAKLDLELALDGL